MSEARPKDIPVPGGDPRNGFVARELTKINKRIVELLDDDAHDAREMDRLRAVQQALSWSLEPTGFKSPFDYAVQPVVPAPAPAVAASYTVTRPRRSARRAGRPR